jgi:hypothetical protein
MDFIEGLPKSEGKDTILVIVDKLTKYSHFISLSHPFTTKTIVQLFIDHVFKLHGLPLAGTKNLLANFGMICSNPWE